MKKNRQSKKILFITGTRADFGKLKSLISVVKQSKCFEYQVFATGMHLLSKYGDTVNEIYKSGFKKVFTYMNQIEGEEMEIVLSNTIKGLSRYLHEHHVDLIMVHGDRVEALAGAIVGALRNILVAHVEGGEVSGTVDEIIRHAISKLSHIHFVTNCKATERLKQLGESPESIYQIGSPDIDIMLSDGLPSLKESKKRYEINYDNYAIAMLHPVTTELDKMVGYAKVFVEALNKSKMNYIVIYPNNDAGTDNIVKAYAFFNGVDNVKLFPSLRFEYFLTLLKHSRFIIGNSSSGMHEAPVYGVPTINIGSRQRNRFNYCSIFHAEFQVADILDAINKVSIKDRFPKTDYYGDGKSAEKFIKALKSDLWDVSNQKQFKDLINL